jgi:GC-rich sequence DNA-binding factor
MSRGAINVTRNVYQTMSDAPVIFKRTKTKPVQRSRQTSQEATIESRDEGESPSTLATKLKKRDKPKSKLSFGAYEDVRGLSAPEVFVLI